jgi:ribose-phosphate pyrophosphokinase
MENNNFVLVCGGASEKLASDIANILGTTSNGCEVIKFSDGEFKPIFNKNKTLRGKKVFIVQSTYMPTDNLFELLLMVDAAKRASAEKVIAIISYLGFSRQDRKDKTGAPVSAALVAKMIKVSGVDQVVTMDLHADQIQGFFDIPVDHIYASNIFAPYIVNMGLENLVIASPDMGGTKKVETYSKYLRCPMVVSYKSREENNVVSTMKVIGDVEGKNVIIMDDMIDTAGTLVKASKIIMDKGALSVRAFATHAVLSGPAYHRIENSILEEVIVTDSIPLKYFSSKIKVLSVAPYFAEVIKKIYNNESISSTFIM